MRSTAARVAVVAVGCLVLGEVVARLWLTAPSAQEPDDALGWAWRPHAHVATYTEGGVSLTLNALGLNDDAVVETPSWRMLVLGNSFVEALQVRRADNFVERAQQLLQERKPGLDIVNLGRSAMHAAHYPVVLSRAWPLLGGDAVVVTVGEGDLVNLLRADIVTERDPSGALTHVGFLPEAKDRMKALFGPILSRSSVVTYLMRRVKPVFEGLANPFVKVEPVPPPDDLRDGPEATARLTWLLRSLRAALPPQVPLLVLDIPSLRYGLGGIATRSAPHESAAYRTAAAQSGLDYLDAGPALIFTYGATGQPGHGFPNLTIGHGHLNAHGHAAVAMALASWIDDQLARSAP